MPCAFEFRNPSWLEPAILDLLRERDAAFAPQTLRRSLQSGLSIQRCGDTCACGGLTIRMPTLHNGLEKDLFPEMGEGIYLF